MTRRANSIGLPELRQGHVQLTTSFYYIPDFTRLVNVTNMETPVGFMMLLRIPVCRH